MAITTTRLLKGWTQTESGGSGTWLWVQRVGDLLKPEDLEGEGGPIPTIFMKDSRAAPTYLFIEIVDMVDACGRDMLDQLDLAGEVYLVEPGSYGARDLNSAFQSCGWEGIKDVIEEFVDSGDDDETSSETQSNRAAIPDIGLLYADFLRNYGNKSPLHSASGGRIVTEKNMHDGVDARRVYALLRELLVEANQYVVNNTALQATLDTKVVNKMGQTSREFAGGIDSTWDTLRRVQDMGDEATPAQKLVLKMYKNAGQTLGGDKVPLDIVANEPLLRGQPCTLRLNP